MKTEIIQVVKLNPASGMHLKNKKTGEIYENYIYLAKSLSAENFEEITEKDYQQIIQSKSSTENIRKFNRHSVTI